MTRNLKFGGDLRGLVNPQDPVPVRMARLWSDVLPPISRARRHVRPGDREHAPALIAIQEVPIFFTQDPSDAIVYGTTPGLAPFNEAQARELIAALQAETLPLILACDCNSRADGTGSRSYGWLVDDVSAGGGGFLDAWSEAHPLDPGFTARLPENLVGPANLTERLDLILVRQGFGAALAAGIVGGVQATVIGEEIQDQTPSGRWPSDHAGVVAILRMPVAVGSK
jgi:hypothetical protein